MATMTTKRFNAKIMNQKLKLGWTITELAEYMYVTEEEFVSMIKRTFSEKAANDMLSTLAKNKKQKDKHINRAKKTRASSNSKVTHEELSEVEMLKQKSDDILKKKQLAENKYVECNSMRLDKISLLEEEEKILSELKNEIKKHEKAATDLTEEIKKLGTSMTGIQETIDSFQVELDIIHENLKELEKLEIFAYANGIIEVDNSSEFVIPESHNEIFETLLKDDKVDVLTLAQIKQLAKLIAYTKSLTEQDVRFNIIFESEEVQKLYEKIA